MHTIWMDTVRDDAVDNPGRLNPRLPRELWWALAAGLLVRLILAPLGWHGYDLYAFGEWSWQLLEHPRSALYAASLEVPPDHLPGDLTIMWALAHLVHRIAPGLDFYAPEYTVILKLVPIVADLALAVGVYAIARVFTTGRRAILIGIAMALNPAAIVISAVWGQWDSVSMAMTVWAVYLLVTGRVVWSLPLLAYACLLKPQLGLLIPLFLIADWRRNRESDRRWWPPFRRWVAGGCISMALVLAVCLPFGVGLPGMATRWSLVDRLLFAAGRYESTSHGAWNLWYALFPESPWDGRQIPGGLSYTGVGLVLLGVALAVAYAGASRFGSWPLGFAWGATVTTMASFMLPTRVHERYLFPAVVCAMLLWIVAPRFRWCATWLSAAAFLNVFMSFASYVPRLDTAWLQDPSLFRVLAMANVAALVVLIAGGFRRPVAVATPGLPAASGQYRASRPGFVGRLGLIVLMQFRRAEGTSRIEPGEPKPEMAEPSDRQDDPALG